MSATGHHISEPPVRHSLHYRQVDDSLLVSVINARKARLLGFSFHDLYLLDELRRDILRCQLGVVKEESLAVNGYLLDSLSVCCNSTVRCHFDSWQLLQEVFEHVIVRCLERRCIIFNGILLHDYRITYSRDAGCIKYLDILLEPDRSKIKILVHNKFLSICFISQYLYFKHICTLPDLGQFCRSLTVCENIFRGLLLSFWSKRCCSKAHRSIRLVIYKT